jgi:predicted nucleic acid-binding Zn ribbon protein
VYHDNHPERVRPYRHCLPCERNVGFRPEIFSRACLPPINKKDQYSPGLV